jgi:NADPH:quinone reductase-like Zn-dependent oxidoreductase
MKANRIHRFGPPEAVVFEEVERPEPGSGEVLVAVKASGAGPWDVWIRTGKSKIEQPLPLTLGSDLSGVVEAVGPGVTAFQAGDRSSVSPTRASLAPTQTTRLLRQA